MKAIETTDGRRAIFCPGCKHAHVLDNRWSFNGDFERPTFSPSLLVWLDKIQPGDVEIRCHSFITDGRIQFLSDSTHALAGQTVELTEFKW